MDADHEFDPDGECVAWMQGTGAEPGPNYVDKTFPSLADLFSWFDGFGNGQIQF